MVPPGSSAEGERISLKVSGAALAQLFVQDGAELVLPGVVELVSGDGDDPIQFGVVALPVTDEHEDRRNLTVSST